MTTAPYFLSVVICTHNPRYEYLERVLMALAAQTLPKQHWELLLIDNASGIPVASNFDLSWHSCARHIHESALGVTKARLRGIVESRGDLIVFVDDDNVLDPDYLAEAAVISTTSPFLGAWGGCVSGEFEVEPAAWTRPHLAMLAIRDVPRDEWSNSLRQTDITPFGAGMCVRSPVARQWVRLVREDPRRLALGRTGGSTNSDEDTDIALVACDMGMGTGVFVRLRLRHLIPARRLELAYLVRLAQGISRSHILLQSLRDPMLCRPAPPALPHRLLRAYHLLRLQPQSRALEQAFERGAAEAFEILERTSDHIASR